MGHPSSSQRSEIFCRAVSHGLTIAIIPVLTLVFLRYFLHTHLGLRFGFANLTDYDFLMPGPAGYFLYLYCLGLAEPLRIRFQRGWFLAYAVFVALFLVINLYTREISAQWPTSYVVGWWASLAGAVVCGFGTTTQIGYFFRNPNRLFALPSLLIATSIYFYMNFFRSSWNITGDVTGDCIHLFFKRYAGSEVTTFFTAEGVLAIVHPDLHLRVGQGCGGLDGLFYFTLLFIVFATLRSKRFSWSQWLLAYCVGILGMFFVNIFRIITLFKLGIWLRQTLGVVDGTWVFKNIAHLQLGWILYTLWAASFFFTLRLVVTKFEFPLINAEESLAR